MSIEQKIDEIKYDLSGIYFEESRLKIQIDLHQSQDMPELYQKYFKFREDALKSDKIYQLKK